MARNSGTWGTPTGVAVGDIRDVVMDSQWAMAIFKKRSNRDALTKPTIRTRVVTGTFEHAPGVTASDANFDAFNDAHEDRTQLELFILNGPLATSGSLGLHAHFYVSKWSRSEPLEDAVTYSFELSLAVDHATSEAPEEHVTA